MREKQFLFSPKTEATGDFIQFMRMWVEKYRPEKAEKITIEDIQKIVDKFLGL